MKRTCKQMSEMIHLNLIPKNKSILILALSVWIGPISSFHETCAGRGSAYFMQISLTLTSMENHCHCDNGFWDKQTCQGCLILHLVPMEMGGKMNCMVLTPKSHESRLIEGNETRMRMIVIHSGEVIKELRGRVVLLTFCQSCLDWLFYVPFPSLLSFPCFFLCCSKAVQFSRY